MTAHAQSEKIGVDYEGLYLIVSVALLTGDVTMRIPIRFSPQAPFHALFIPLLMDT